MAVQERTNSNPVTGDGLDGARFRRLKNGADGEPVERYAVCLVNEGSLVTALGVSIVSYLPAIRRFLNEVCPAGVGDLGTIADGRGTALWCRR
jgi:hypothetical protein